MRVWARAGKCLAQWLSPPHTLAQVPLFLLTGTGAPDPSQWSILCSLQQSESMFEMKPSPYACLKLWLWIPYHCLSSSISAHYCDFHRTWRLRAQFGVDLQNALCINGVQCILNLTDSLVSIYLLHQPSWFSRLCRSSGWDLSLPHIVSITNEVLFLNYWVLKTRIVFLCFSGFSKGLMNISCAWHELPDFSFPGVRRPWSWPWGEIKVSWESKWRETKQKDA